MAVRGKRYIVGNLTSEDIVVRAKTGSITEPGIYTVELVAEQVEYTDEYEIVDIRPGTVNITFEMCIRDRSCSVMGYWVLSRNIERKKPSMP